jgi:hypothetical protein
MKEVPRLKAQSFERLILGHECPSSLLQEGESVLEQKNPEDNVTGNSNSENTKGADQKSAPFV